MIHFISYKSMIEKLITDVVAVPLLHGKWLNTLSYLENCGACKIASSEHPLHVRKEMLKHAQEEFRHAYTLKRQIEKITKEPLIDYSLPHILGSYSTLFYLHRLDTTITRYIQNVIRPTKKADIKMVAYLFVTYAIEKRAEELYPLYETILRKERFPISVAPILKEEKGHLQEIEEAIASLFLEKEVHTRAVLQYERECTQKWLQSIQIH